MIFSFSSNICATLTCDTDNACAWMLTAYWISFVNPWTMASAFLHSDPEICISAFTLKNVNWVHT
jgi:hypothetical protein